MRPGEEYALVDVPKAREPLSFHRVLHQNLQSIYTAAEEHAADAAAVRPLSVCMDEPSVSKIILGL